MFGIDYDKLADKIYKKLKNDENKLESKLIDSITDEIIYGYDFMAMLRQVKYESKYEIIREIKIEVLEKYRAEILSEITKEDLLKATLDSIKEETVKKTAEIIKGQ